MSKKDYVAIGEAIAEAVTEYRNDHVETSGIISLNNMIDEVSRVFKRDNYNFDENRFNYFVTKKLDERFHIAK